MKEIQNLQFEKYYLSPLERKAHIGVCINNDKKPCFIAVHHEEIFSHHWCTRTYLTKT